MPLRRDRDLSNKPGASIAGLSKNKKINFFITAVKNESKYPSSQLS